MSGQIARGDLGKAAEYGEPGLREPHRAAGAGSPGASHADFSRADLRGADLSRGWGRGCFPAARVEAARLRGAELQGRDFTGATLKDADLREATLLSCVVTAGQLAEADTAGAFISPHGMQPPPP